MIGEIRIYQQDGCRFEIIRIEEDGRVYIRWLDQPGHLDDWFLSEKSVRHHPLDKKYILKKILDETAGVVAPSPRIVLY